MNSSTTSAALLRKTSEGLPPVRASVVEKPDHDVIHAEIIGAKPHDEHVPVDSFIDDVQRKKKLRKVMKPDDHSVRPHASEIEDENDGVQGPEPILDKTEANYRYAADQSRSCGTCQHFQGDGSCDMVAGLIRPIDTCDFYEAEGTPDDHHVRALVVGTESVRQPRKLSRSFDEVRARRTHRGQFTYRGSLPRFVQTSEDSEALSVSQRAIRRRMPKSSAALGHHSGVSPRTMKKPPLAGKHHKTPLPSGKPIGPLWHAGRFGSFGIAAGGRGASARHGATMGSRTHMPTKARASEVSPPGWSGTIDAMKSKHGFPAKKAFALSWWMYKRGRHSHVTPEPGHPGARTVGGKKVRTVDSECFVRAKLCESAPTCMKCGATFPSNSELEHFDGKCWRCGASVAREARTSKAKAEWITIGGRHIPIGGDVKGEDARLIDKFSKRENPKQRAQRIARKKVDPATVAAIKRAFSSMRATVA